MRMLSDFRSIWGLGSASRTCKILGTLVLCGSMVAAGCNTEKPSEKLAQESASSSGGVSSVSPPAGSAHKEMPTSNLLPKQVRLRQVDKAGFDRWLQTQAGKVVLVDFWATWCTPCRELFPHTVELARRFSSKGLVVVSVSMDDPESEPMVRQFLAQQGAEFENFIAIGPPDPFAAFQISGGALPHLKIYGPDGKVFRQIGSDQQVISSAHVDHAVQEALSQLSPKAPSP